jgi:tetratricopeptide (TPR) repeat protein
MPSGRASLLRLAGFLEPAGHGRFRFRHALIRAAAYQGLSFRRRRELHGRVGELLESGAPVEDQAELLSLHFFHAGRADKAWQYSRLAGDRSRARYAYVEAAEFYSRAVESARRLDEIDDGPIGLVLESLADMQTRSGDVDDARRSYRAARRITDEPVRTAHLLLMEAKLDRHQGRSAQSMRTLTRGLGLLDRAARTDEPTVLAQRATLESFYAWGRYRQGRYRDAVEWGHRAQAHAIGSGAKAALAEVYAVLQQVSTVSQYAHEERYGEMALKLYTELGDVWQQANMLNNLAGTAYFEGRWSDAVDLYGRALAGYESVGHQLGVASIQYNLAEIQARQRRFVDAEARLVRARDIAHRFGDHELEAIAIRELGRLLVLTGRMSEGVALLAEAAEATAALGEAYEVLATDVEVAAARLAQGDADAALAGVVEARDRASALGAVAQLPTIGRIHGSALLELGRLDEARSVLEQALAECEKQGSFETGFVLVTLADALDRAGDPGGPGMREDGRKRLTELDVLLDAADG